MSEGNAAPFLPTVRVERGQPAAVPLLAVLVPPLFVLRQRPERAGNIAATFQALAVPRPDRLLHPAGKILINQSMDKGPRRTSGDQ